MYREFKFAPDEYYHIYNRGTEKREIFTNTQDYIRFIESLYLFNTEKRIVLKMVSKEDRFSYDRGETIVNIGAYCLMPNHFHLLIRAKNDEGISSFMKKLQTAYSMYFNKRYGRNGSLFQGPFKAQHVLRDEYLKYLFSYIHLNPIKLIDKDWKDKGIQNLDQAKMFLDSYKYLSHLDYLLEERQESSILDRSAFPDYFGSINKFDDFINFWLTFKNNIEKYTL